MELSFNVTGQTITRADELLVVADSRKIISLTFEFSEEWDTIATKTAVITTDGHTYYATIDSEGKVSADDMPILKSGLCYFSVFGGYVEDTAELQTANELFINVMPSGLKTEDPAPPTPGKYDEIKAIAENAEDIAQGVRTDADNGVFDGEQGVSIVSAIIDEDSHFIITLSNGDVIDTGVVIQGAQGIQGVQGLQGIQGLKGDTGATGRGITSISVNATNQLLIVYSDSPTPINVGTIDGYTKAQIDTLLTGYIPTAQKGVANGISTLDSNGVNAQPPKASLISETTINTPAISATLTVDTVNDKISFSANRPPNGTPLQFEENGGTLPAPFVKNEVYYAYNSGTNDIEFVSTYNGTSKIDITSTGSGAWYIRVAGVSAASISIPDVNTNYRLIIDAKTALVGTGTNIVAGVNSNTTLGVYESNVQPGTTTYFTLGATSGTDKYARYMTRFDLFKDKNNYVGLLGVFSGASSSDNVTYTVRANAATSGIAKINYSTLTTFDLLGSVNGKYILNGSKIVLERVY